MEEISEYLGRATVKDYQEGVQLYNLHGDNAYFKKQLATSRPISYFPYLVSELKKLLKSNSRYNRPLTVKPPTDKARSTPSPVSIESPTVKPLSGKVKTEYNKVVDYRKSQYVKMAKLRNSLVDITTDGERALASEKVLELKAENDQLWRELDFYDQYKKWENGYPLAYQEEKSEAPTPSKSRLKQDLKNVQGKIRRKKQKLELLKADLGEDSPKYLKHEAEFKELQLEEISIKEKLKNG